MAEIAAQLAATLCSQNCIRPPMEMDGDIVCWLVLLGNDFERASCDRSSYRGEPRVVPSSGRLRCRSYFRVAPAPRCSALPCPLWHLRCRSFDWPLRGRGHQIDDASHQVDGASPESK